MARGGLRGNNYCPECGQQFEILSGDVQFSLNIHMLSHKSPEIITQEIDQRMKNVQVGPKNKNKADYTCPECKESVVIFNNDISFSLQHHAQKHKPVRTVGNSEDQSSTSSGKSKSSEKKSKGVVSNPSVPKQINILDGIFDSMPPGLKLHRGFISENENGKAMCYICNVTIESMFSISEHLKTKSHEDKTVKFLTNMLPTELRHVMKFVSFYGSNLSCNLCRNKIDLCSDNHFKTIINIMSHNSSKGHFKADEEPRSNSNGATVILNSLSKIIPAVSSNKHLIECKMQPHFKCKMCDKNIGYDENEKNLYHNFDSHFTSKGHVKCVEATSVFEGFSLSQFPGKERHNLILTKGNIFCTICNCNIVANLEQLVSHVKLPPKIEIKAQTSENITPLKSLLNSLPPQLRNTNCIVECAQGQVKCLVCNRIIAVSALPSHLLGKSHKTKAGEIKPDIERNPKQGVNSLTEEVVLLKNMFEEIPRSLRKDAKFMKAVNKEKLHCSVCNYDVPALTMYLQEHLQSAAHLKTVKIFELTKLQEQKKQQAVKYDVLLETLKQSDTFIRSCAKYLIRSGDQFKCCLCDGKLSKANDEKTLKNNILTHMNGKNHKNSEVAVYNKLLDTLEQLDPRVKSDRQFLGKQQGGIYCSLCSFTVSAPTEFEGFRATLLQHLTGSQHNGNKLNMNKKNIAPTLTPMSSNGNFSSPTKMDFFLKSFPLQFHEEVTFLRPSSVEGFLSCTLCNSIINPHYLKEHFEDLNHIQKKSLQKPQKSNTDQSEDQTIAKNMGTLIALLGSIDKKLSWQGN